MHPPVEVEVIYFPKTKCLGIQCHPEMMSYYDNSHFSDAVDYFRMLLNRFMFDNIYVDRLQNHKLKAPPLKV